MPARRVIEVNRGIVGPTAPRPRQVVSWKPSDFARTPKVYLDLAGRLSAPLLMGPPLCPELLAFLQHVFTEEEAGAARHLRLRGSTPQQVAAAEGREVEAVRAVLEHLARVKRVILSGGSAGKEKYYLPPIMPGIFEMALISVDPQNMSEWHRRFAELFEALYETGYAAEYQQGLRQPTPLARTLAVGKALDAHPAALPSDRMEVVLDRYKVFAVGQCQCRLTMQAVGQACGKPLGNCLVMGEWAGPGIEQGILRQVSRQEALALKREAEDHGMVNWIMNVESSRGQASCSCCGCCCHAMRMVNQFSMPGMIAPAHFLPQFDDGKCNHCGRCASRCPMGALAVDTAHKSRRHDLARCIGCGQCKLACTRQQAISLAVTPDYRLPYRSWLSLLLHTAPTAATAAWRVWRRR